MNEQQAIEIVQQQFEESKRWQHVLRSQQSEDDYKHAITGIHALGIVLELAKKQVEEVEE